MDDVGKEGALLPSFPEGERWGKRTNEVLERHKSLLRTIGYRGDLPGRVEQPLPYFDFSDASQRQQQVIMKELYDAAVADGKELFLEVGPGERLSPLETALQAKNRVVFAVDQAFQPMHHYSSELARSLASSGAEQKSYAVFFESDAKKLDRTLQFDRVQMVFPIPFEQLELVIDISRHVRSGGDMLVIVDPMISGEPTAEDIAKALPEDFQTDITEFDWNTIKFLFGISDTEISKEDRTPVLLAHRR